MAVNIERVYDLMRFSKAKYFLVDRLWPRGMSKERLARVTWTKEVAPSTSLRKWFGHDPDRWREFQRRYFEELDEHPEAWKPILKAAKEGSVILLYSARDPEHNQAVALKNYLKKKLARAKQAA
ncbi:MAG TPA: DUF488 family protein [Candidatus Obscuribacterales bacterium]